MKKVVPVIAFLFFLLLSGTSFGQNKLSIDKVYSVTLRNSGSIISNGLIKGYYFLYQSDKIDRNTNEYTLSLIDENLNKIKDIKFSDSKHIALLESSFNGSSLAFMFYNDNENTLEYRIYGMDGKETNVYSQVLDKKSDSYFKMVRSQSSKEEEAENQNMFSLQGKGFLSIIPQRENKNYTYEVNFYSSEKKRMWTYNPQEEGKFTTAQYLGANDSIALVEVLTKAKLLSKELESTLVGIQLSTGRKAFEIKTNDGKNQLYPMNLASVKEPGQFMLIGPYFNGDDRVLQDKSEGLGIWLMNNQGKIQASKYMSWARDVSKYLKVDQRGRIEDLGYVYFHHLMQTSDGKIFAIGEGYKKTANAAGIALSVLTRSYASNTTKLVITDMLLLELSDKFDLKGAKIYEKNRNNFAIPGADFQNPHTLALVAKTFGAFDYSFTQMNKDNSSFMSGYTDYERSKDYKGLTFNSISYYDGKITTDKINLKTNASSMHILPAKPGSILLLEYFKKDKRLDLHMEKLN